MYELAHLDSLVRFLSFRGCLDENVGKGDGFGYMIEFRFGFRFKTKGDGLEI